MHSDVTEGGLVFENALNLSKSGWIDIFNYTISNGLDSSVDMYSIPKRKVMPIARL